MSGHMSDRENAALSTGYILSSRMQPEVRRNFRLSDKERIVAETMGHGASVSSVARRYGITPRLLFRWKRELAPPPEPVFLPVAVSDTAQMPAMAPAAPMAAPIIIERPVHEIEIELTGGRRVRFGRDTDPQTVRAMVAMLEGGAS